MHPWRGVGRRSCAPDAQGPRVWRAEPTGSERGSRWHSKGGRLYHMYTARAPAPARSQPEAAARSNVPTCPAYLGGGGGRA